MEETTIQRNTHGWVEELQFPEVQIPITIDQKFSVLPAGPIPVKHGDTLYLSNLDDIVGARVFTPTVYFFRSNAKQETKLVLLTLREALANVLVPYYPLSGRVKETMNRKLEVFFGPEQGALIVAASSTMSLDELGDVSVPNPGWAPLIYRFPNEEPYKVLDMPLVIAQVTSFRCGGFSLGLRLCHCICDGLGAMQFLRAWAASAKLGALTMDVEPCWNREVLKPRDPPLVEYPHTEFMRLDDGSSLTSSLWRAKPVQKCYKVSPEFLLQLKSAAQSGSTPCTTFESLAAHIWRSWVKALDVQPLDYTLRLTFSVNAREKLKNPALKPGFYGNVVCLACTVCNVSDLVDKRLSETTCLVRESRLGICEEYLRSTIDYVESNRPVRLEFGGKLTITQWTRFSIYESADFGWGRPLYAGPIDLTPTPQVCVLLPEAAASGSMVVCICLPKEACYQFKNFFSDITHNI